MTEPPTTPLSPILSHTSQGELSKRSRFKFHSDKAPLELKAIETDNHKRHTEFRIRVNDLDHQIAKWLSRFANEILERDRESSTLFEDAVTDPLERCAERFMRRLELEFGILHGATTSLNGVLDDGEGDNDDETYDDASGESGNGNGNYTESESDTGTGTRSASPAADKAQNVRDGDREESGNNDDNDPDEDEPSNLQDLSHEISKLSSNLMQHIHVTTPALKYQHLDSFHRQMQGTIPPKIHMEKTKAAKREQAIFQKFESMAGLASRSLAEENAARVAELQILEQKILEAGGWDERRSSRFLEEVREIRTMLEQEQEERIANDQMVLEAIVSTRTILHKTLLESG
mmetsp:Transcript_10614/g.16096  ORF Transcript_10614/g.16096 Transcript_10614/m.16096 type:complete len:347 (+) Transcript_10614:22-1062(+)